MKQMPQIQKVMTKLPRTIGHDIPVIRAEALMRSEGFRHLPVLDGGRLVGILSDRDITLAAALGDSKMKVADVMMPDPYVARPDYALDRVVMEMAWFSRKTARSSAYLRQSTDSGSSRKRSPISIGNPWNPPSPAAMAESSA